MVKQVPVEVMCSVRVKSLVMVWQMDPNTPNIEKSLMVPEVTLLLAVSTVESGIVSYAEEVSLYW